MGRNADAAGYITTDTQWRSTGSYQCCFTGTGAARNSLQTVRVSCEAKNGIGAAEAQHRLGDVGEDERDATEFLQRLNDCRIIVSHWLVEVLHITTSSLVVFHLNNIS